VVAPLIPHHLANRYWLHTALIALMILLAYDLAEFDSESISKLLFERVIDMLLGCTIALVGTAAAFPRTAVTELDTWSKRSQTRPARNAPAARRGRVASNRSAGVHRLPGGIARGAFGH
jgi:uncharacterized membrane protein YccC